MNKLRSLRTSEELFHFKWDCERNVGARIQLYSGLNSTVGNVVSCGSRWVRIDNTIINGQVNDPKEHFDILLQDYNEYRFLPELHIEILHSKVNGWVIKCGDKISEQLGYDEMLGLMVALSMPKERPCLQWMHTEAELEAMAARYRYEPIPPERSLQPTIGVMPQWLHVERRMSDLSDAIMRRLDANQEVPRDWWIEHIKCGVWLTKYREARDEKKATD